MYESTSFTSYVFDNKDFDCYTALHSAAYVFPLEAKSENVVSFARPNESGQEATFYLAVLRCVVVPDDVSVLNESYQRRPRKSPRTTHRASSKLFRHRISPYHNPEWTHPSTTLGSSSPFDDVNREGIGGFSVNLRLSNPSLGPVMREFSYEEVGLVASTSTYFGLFALLMIFQVLQTWWLRRYPIVSLSLFVLLVVWTEFLSLLVSFVELLTFSGLNGGKEYLNGVPVARLVSLVLDTLSESLLIFLLVLLSRGWMIEPNAEETKKNRRSQSPFGTYSPFRLAAACGRVGYGKEIFFLGCYFLIAFVAGVRSHDPNFINERHSAVAVVLAVSQLVLFLVGYSNVVLALDDSSAESNETKSSVRSMRTKTMGYVERRRIYATVGFALALWGASVPLEIAASYLIAYSSTEPVVVSTVSLTAHFLGTAIICYALRRSRLVSLTRGPEASESSFSTDAPGESSSSRRRPVPIVERDAFFDVSSDEDESMPFV